MHSVRLNSRIGPPKRFRQFKRGHRSGTLAGRAILIASLFCLTDGISALAIETSTALAPTSANSEFSLEPDYKKYQKERRAIEAMLSDIEIQWNAHNLESVLKHYADDYINNDGLDKKAVRELTKDFWKTYPDAKSSSKTKQIRIEGKFATVESRDRAVGSTAKAMPSVQSKGELISISEGQLYLKRTGNDWKIIGDRIDYEKVKVAFGLARDLETSFIAPEQVKSGREYSAKLKVVLSGDLVAVGSIVSEPLKYPQPSHKDVWRPVDDQVLERLIHANKNNYNELLMATIGITDGSRKTLKGLTYLTRRLNVVPETKSDSQEKGEDADKQKSAKIDTEKNPGKNSDIPSIDSDKNSDKDSGADDGADE